MCCVNKALTEYRNPAGALVDRPERGQLLERFKTRCKALKVSGSTRNGSEMHLLERQGHGERQWKDMEGRCSVGSRASNCQSSAARTWTDSHQRDEQPCLMCPTCHLFGCAAPARAAAQRPAGTVRTRLARPLRGPKTKDIPGTMVVSGRRQQLERP